MSLAFDPERQVSHIRFNLNGLPRRPYIIQGSHNLHDWQDIGRAFSSGNGGVEAVETAPGRVGIRFYRLREATEYAPFFSDNP